VPAATVITWIALCVPAFPALAFAVLALLLLLGRSPSERFITRMNSLCLSVSVFASLAVALWFLLHDEEPIHVPLGTWIESAGYAFDASMLIDELSAPMMVLTAVLCGIIGRFSRTYLHREPGQPRFFLLLSLFASGMFLLVMAGSIDLLIAGWELVGLSSMLLIGFFHERPYPVRNALRAFVTYRVCDIGLLVGLVLMHHYLGTGEFADAFGIDGWPAARKPLVDAGPVLVVLCFFVAACGKSALFPVGSWLPRAMEGPTPSSAIFYGSLSVHAGAYLMLRMMPLLAHAFAARVVIVVIGLLTAVHGTLVQRVQTDVKSQLAYATTTQVGVIFVEIGLGFPRIALLHLVSHACLRTLQMLRAPNVIHDAMLMRAAAGPTAARAHETVSSPLRVWLYHLSLERFHLDAFLQMYVARPVLALAAMCERLEQKYLALLVRALPHPNDRNRSEVPTSPSSSRRGP
jgi:NADH:ubiquinone oxidoreductase subunit 5 (subunit L)/multisubunit Na+/H+ antiporter MnhA subunit